MKSQSSARTISSVVIFVLIVGAVILAARIVKARLAPRALRGVEGHLLFYSKGNIFEIPSGSKSESAADLRIAGPDVEELYIAFWPEKNRLAYRTKNGIELLDLDTREVKTFSTGGANCATWAPDLASISYVLQESGVLSLYLYDVGSQTSTLVYTSPAGTYSDGRTYYGGVTCGAWIGTDRFVFDRQVGMPSQMTSINGVATGVGTNTTTLAIIGESITLVDSPRQISIYGVSDDGKHLIYGEQEPGAINLYHVSLPPAFDSFELPSPRQIASEIYYNSFTMVGNEVLYDDYDNEKTRIHIVNLDTFEEQFGPTIPTGLYSWAWIGDPKDNVIGFTDAVSGVWFEDLDTHAMTEMIGEALLKDMQNLGSGFPSGTFIIGWLPSK